MTADRLHVERVLFPASREARLLRVHAGSDPAAAATALQLPTGRPVVVVNGGTSPLPSGVQLALGELLAGVAAVAVDDGATLVTGGTHAGVFALLGAALARLDGPYVCVGVAPGNATVWPGKHAQTEASEDEHIPLEAHNTHFVVVDGVGWGGETPMLLDLTSVLSAPAPSVVLLAGGGDIAATELIGHLRAERPVIVLKGSGRLADQVVAVLSTQTAVAGALGEITERAGLVEICDLHAGPAALRLRLRRHLERT